MTEKTIDQLLEDIVKYEGEVTAKDYGVEESVLKTTMHALKKAHNRQEKAKKILAKKLHISS
jgi:uncharacterized protein YheU (UPF0270 family)